MDRLLTIDETAAALKLSPRTLERLRQEGGGPSFCRPSAGKVAYLESDIDAFLRSRRFSSTSQLVQEPGSVSKERFATLRFRRCTGRSNQSAVAQFFKAIELELGAVVATEPGAGDESESFLIYAKSDDAWEAYLLCGVLTYGAFVYGLDCNIRRQPRLDGYLHRLNMDWKWELSARIRHIARQTCWRKRDEFALGRSASKPPFKASDIDIKTTTSFPALKTILEMIGVKAGFGLILEQALKEKPIPNAPVSLVVDDDLGATKTLSVGREVEKFFGRLPIRVGQSYCVAAPETNREFATSD